MFSFQTKFNGIICLGENLNTILSEKMYPTTFSLLDTVAFSVTRFPHNIYTSTDNQHLIDWYIDVYSSHFIKRRNFVVVGLNGGVSVSYETACQSQHKHVRRAVNDTLIVVRSHWSINKEMSYLVLGDPIPDGWYTDGKITRCSIGSNLNSSKSMNDDIVSLACGLSCALTTTDVGSSYFAWNALTHTSEPARICWWLERICYWRYQYTWRIWIRKLVHKTRMNYSGVLKTSIKCMRSKNMQSNSKESGQVKLSTYPKTQQFAVMISISIGVAAASELND